MEHFELFDIEIFDLMIFELFFELLNFSITLPFLNICICKKLLCPLGLGGGAYKTQIQKNSEFIVKLIWLCSHWECAVEESITATQILLGQKSNGKTNSMERCEPKDH